MFFFNITNVCELTTTLATGGNDESVIRLIYRLDVSA